jgi:hypothetical protein
MGDQVDAKIPHAEVYRGVRVHCYQPVERIEQVVRPEIDAVHAMTDAHVLYRFAVDVAHAPESRLYARARLEALFEISAEDRTARPGGIDIKFLRAATAGLDILRWLDPGRYKSLLDPRQGAVRREHYLSGEMIAQETASDGIE